MPFVFEVPTTIERLHEMIETHASTGKEVSLIIERIHASNSVRLDKKNMEKMQNFYDVLLRRFVAVGDAIHTSGRGGIELNRYEQLDAITRILYTMAQDAPESAGAVWGRRLGVFQNAHAKRMRDRDLGVRNENEDSMAWPGLGTLLLFRALPHIFPVTDRSHQVVTPAMLLLCQIVSQAPVSSISDLISGLFSCGVIFEFSKEAHRLVPEAIGFLSSALRLFSPKPIHMKLPNMKVIQHQEFRRQLISPDYEEKTFLPLEKAEIEKPSTVTSIFYSILYLVDTWIEKFGNSLNGGEPEAFSELSSSLKALSSSSKKSPLPPFAIKRIAITQTKLSLCLSVNRGPLARRMDTSTSKSSIKSLAPRLEDPERYRKSKDQGKNSNQIAVGRMQREFKREHKAVARELRLDGVFVENERRREKEKKDSLERAKRHKNLAWLEGEQAAMNQQVAQGGGLLSGGGMGAARSKAKSAKLGIKKGGKF
jgi:nucleolar protein 14